MAIAWASTDDKLVFKNFNWTENTQSYEWKNNEWVPATNGYATNTYQYYQTETHKGYLRNVNIGFPEETWKNWISK